MTAIGPVLTDFRDSIDPKSDPSTFGFYSFLADNLIPAIDALRVGDWHRAWEALGEETAVAFAAGITNSDTGKIFQQLAIDLAAHNGLAFIQDMGKLFGGGGGGAKGPNSEMNG